MKLFIAEKPSAAEAIAVRLPGATRKRGYWECDDAIVTYCAGHLYELAKPEAYDPALAAWRADVLPFVPDEWRWVPNPKAQDLIENIQRWLDDPRIDTVINAGDADREGQAIVDVPLAIHQNQKRTLRFLVSAQDPASIDKGLRSLAANETYEPWGFAAMARACADWTHGINCTRAQTITVRVNGGNGVRPVGRVQTPTLNLVVVRDRLIENFVPVPFYVVEATMQHENGSYVGRWNPPDDTGLDDENRLIDPAVAQAVIEDVQDQAGSITHLETKAGRKRQPGGFSLTGISTAASRAFGYGVAQVLEICQALYEKHKLTSYPRSDSGYLPTSQLEAAPGILSALSANLPQIQQWIDGADTGIESPIWNDKKIEAHHAIIPTGYQGDMSALSQEEMNVYMLIAQNYLAQFYPACEFDETTVQTTIGQHLFGTKGRVVTNPGWTVLYANDTDEDAAEGEDSQALPSMEQDDAVTCIDVQAQQRKTTPPKHFTEASLQTTMENIHRYVDDENEKALLKDGDGIGTPATRAAIIEDLGKRGFLAPKGKYIISTDTAREHIDSLPVELTSPGITARFESGLTAVQRGELSRDDFLAEQSAWVKEQVSQILAPTLPKLAAITRPCPACGAGTLWRVARKDDTGHFWSCDRRNAKKDPCEYIVSDEDGEPGQPREQGPSHECPHCGKGQIRRIARKDGSGHFWSCSRWKDKKPCSYSVEDVEGEPGPYVVPDPVYKCPKCKKGQIRRVARKDDSGHFWSCNRWRDGCKFTTGDNEGTPKLD
ncbi:MAG TPA: DNA topoisomerase 3 [Eoetvoesiella sp.]